MASTKRYYTLKQRKLKAAGLRVYKRFVGQEVKMWSRCVVKTKLSFNFETNLKHFLWHFVYWHILIRFIPVNLLGIMIQITIITSNRKIL